MFTLDTTYIIPLSTPNTLEQEVRIVYTCFLHLIDYKEVLV